jgi:hypothetical protein
MLIVVKQLAPYNTRVTSKEFMLVHAAIKLYEKEHIYLRKM